MARRSNETSKSSYRKLQSEATRKVLNQLIDLAEKAAPKTLAEIPVIPSTPFTPGVGVAIHLRESLGTLQRYYNNPPKGKRGYVNMVRDLAGDQDALLMLPGGNGKIPVPIEVIERQIEKLL